MYLIIIIQLVIVVSLVKGLFSSIAAGKRVDELLLKKQKLTEEKSNLEGKKGEVESEYYLEKVAREQLHLVKPGEVVVMTPEIKNDGSNKTEDKAEDKNWGKWLAVFWND